MRKEDKIFVAGHRGMVGSAICRNLELQGFGNVITIARDKLPLDDFNSVNKFFNQEKPDYVFLAAAKVGGIYANTTFPANFIAENLKIQNNVIESAYRSNTQKLLFLGSSCIYPKNARQPIIEESLLTGPLETTNIAYATAKIAGKIMCDAYSAQHGCKFFTVMPSNIYGIGDNFHPENSHLVAGMMRRFHEAKLQNLEHVSVWGTGSPMRELTFADDLGRACVHLMQTEHNYSMINVGSSCEISVADLALKIKELTNFSGEIIFDSDKPDGTPRKIMDSQKFKSLGEFSFIDLDDGLDRMYTWYRNLSNTLA